MEVNPLNKTMSIIVVLFAVVGVGSFLVSYFFLAGPLDNKNNSSVNGTLKEGNRISYSSEYISFKEAKSIAKKNAPPGASVDDPILIKDKSGKAVYICSYYSKDVWVGGIIIDARTGKVIYREIFSIIETPSYDQPNDQYTDQSSYQQPQYCDVCRGDGWITCPECGGYGYDDYGNPCSNCDGSGYITCDKCGGTGTI